MMIVVALLAGVPVGAFAGGVWRYPATLCRYDGKQASDTYFNTWDLGVNALENTSTSLREAVCPMILFQNDSAQNYIGQAAFSIDDTSGRCRIYHRHYSGTSYGWWGHDSIYVDQVSRNFQFGTPGYYYDCTNRNCSFHVKVPAGAVISGYQYSPGYY